MRTRIECRHPLPREDPTHVIGRRGKLKSAGRPDGNLAAQPVGLTSELVLTVVDATRPRGVRAEIVLQTRDPVPALRRRNGRPATRGGMIERARLKVEVRA